MDPDFKVNYRITICLTSPKVNVKGKAVVRNRYNPVQQHKKKTNKQKIGGQFFRADDHNLQGTAKTARRRQK